MGNIIPVAKSNRLETVVEIYLVIKLLDREIVISERFQTDFFGRNQEFSPILLSDD